MKSNKYIRDKLFILNNNTFVLNTSALGTDACVISSFDNMIVEYLIGGKARKTKINEPNYVTFARGFLVVIL